ncbi:hypothetical protein CL684_00895 [Candidatus Campbellbacteria bacterium]|nr:hypothetical protein [Candidatus Campbellbacteria bacterium]|tara:strand:+ start:2467 stop:2838 length:372 start_codon:yes stop_codon:yes gene_type:complete
MNISSFIKEYIAIPVAHAQAPEEVVTLMGKINEQLLNPLIILMFTAAIILFLVGLFNFFQAQSGDGGSDEALKKGKRNMVWGIIGMAIMVSVFGIMNFIGGTLGLDRINPDESADFSGLRPGQ